LLVGGCFAGHFGGLFFAWDPGWSCLGVRLGLVGIVLCLVGGWSGVGDGLGMGLGPLARCVYRRDCRYSWIYDGAMTAWMASILNLGSSVVGGCGVS
jgi:hypothetical protein